MAHRIQITLTEAQYARLTRESERSGLALAEVVRRSLDATASHRDFDAALERSFGAWTGRGIDGKEYVERLRRPGLGKGLKPDAA